jgi:hypothetical protein
MMGHNVWLHLNSVQEANRQYDAGLCPAMLVDERFNRTYFKDVVEAIFSTPNRQEAEDIIEMYSKFWMAIPGTRGATGKKTVNASTMFSSLFDEVEEDSVQLEEEVDFDESAIDKLDDLEAQLHNDAT